MSNSVGAFKSSQAAAQVAATAPSQLKKFSSWMSAKVGAVRLHVGGSSSSPSSTADKSVRTRDVRSVAVHVAPKQIPTSSASTRNDTKSVPTVPLERDDFSRMDATRIDEEGGSDGDSDSPETSVSAGTDAGVRGSDFARDRKSVEGHAPAKETLVIHARPWAKAFDAFRTALVGDGSGQVRIEKSTFMRSDSPEGKALAAQLRPGCEAHFADMASRIGARYQATVAIGDTKSTLAKPFGRETAMCSAIAAVYRSVRVDAAIPSKDVGLLREVRQFANKHDFGAGESALRDQLVLRSVAVAVAKDRALPDAKQLARVLQFAANGIFSTDKLVNASDANKHLFEFGADGYVLKKDGLAVLSEAGLEATQEFREAFGRASAAIQDYLAQVAGTSAGVEMLE